MTAYAIALLEELEFGPDIVSYLHRIDATLEPFEGRFLVHGTRPEVVEGPFAGDGVVIGFPSLEQAKAWYASPAYAALIPLRTQHSRSTVFFLKGVAPGYRAASLLDKLQAQR